ncbi:unnamed protein product [Didymodactylos carnosus]|uniref:Uncharacterized protein n=1 Tax=Didymodactylos carnosus TaxID=1234261 RepID=A0A815GNS6_9BILA|nr:unnamed protein product [Didymodactylos carnosus]CAF4201524.1 unnamed protein product [Didymodactylos carnosus]
MSENPEILSNLLNYCDQPDIEDKTGATPMMFALGVSGACLEKIKLLIEKHASINRKDKTGWSLLHAAVSSKRRDILELLLSNGGDVHIIDGDGRSLLHIACDNGDTLLSKFLIEKGVSLANIDKNGWTPFHVACGPADDYELVHHLIQVGADPTVKDINGHTPLHWAKQFKAKNVERYLTKFLNQNLDVSDEDENDIDSDSDLGTINGVYESDVFESEPTSQRNSSKRNSSKRNSSKKPIENIELADMNSRRGVLAPQRFSGKILKV